MRWRCHVENMLKCVPLLISAQHIYSYRKIPDIDFENVSLHFKQN